MLIKEMFNIANIKCDDNIDAYTQLIYFNMCVSILNIECGFNLPIKNLEDVNKEYNVCINDFGNNILANIIITYIAYHTKKTEGYTDSQNPFYMEFLALKMKFNSSYAHLIKDEYKLKEGEDMSTTSKKSFPGINFKKSGVW